MLLDEVLHLGLREGVDGLRQLKTLPGAEILDELIGAEALLALAAVHQRVGEAAQMAGGHPRLRVHQDRGIQTDVIGILLHEFLPPGALDVVFQLDAERAVVPRVGKAAVDLGAGEDIAAVFAQRDQLVHGFFGIFEHSMPPKCSNSINLLYPVSPAMSIARAAEKPFRRGFLPSAQKRIKIQKNRIFRLKSVDSCAILKFHNSERRRTAFPP